MPGLEEVRYYINGLRLMILYQVDAFKYLDISQRGYRRSWWAMVYCLPVLFINMFFSRAYVLGSAPGAHLPQGFYANFVLSYPVSWLFPYLVLWPVLALLGDRAYFKPIILVFNWLTVPAQYILGLILMGFLAFSPDEVMQFAALYTYVLLLAAVYVIVATRLMRSSVLSGFAVSLAMFAGSIATQIYFDDLLQL